LAYNKVVPHAGRSCSFHQEGDMSQANAAAGVDYQLMNPWKRMMRGLADSTRRLPFDRRKMFITEDGTWSYLGDQPYREFAILESQGHKTLFAEMMYRLTNDARYFAGMGFDTLMMTEYDLLRRGALPFAYLLGVGASADAWFNDERRIRVIVESFRHACEASRAALLTGDSPALPYLVKPSAPSLPVPDAAVFFGSGIGIIAPPERMVRDRGIDQGSQIIGVASQGYHTNGSSPIIRNLPTLSEGLLHVLPDNRCLGEHLLVPTPSYADLVEALIKECEIFAIKPLTGDGAAKMARDRAPWQFTYRIRRWPAPTAFWSFLRAWLADCGVTTKDFYETFNAGIGMVFIVPERMVDRALAVGRRIGHELMHLGHVEYGPRRVILEHESGVELAPSGE